MAIYPDKKNGKLNGRWRVELQQGGQRYRKRWDAHADAVKDEEAVLKAWADGEDLTGSQRAAGAPEVHTFDTVIPLAQGQLWSGDSSEECCWARINSCAAILGRKTRLDAVDTLSVDKIVKALKAKDLSDGTVNRYLSHLRTFLVWAKGRKYRTLPVTGDDGIKFAWRKESVGRIRWVTHEEEAAVGEFLMASDKDEAHDVWDLIQVAIETGCRRDELITCEAGQINGTRLHLWETKTDYPRTVPMTQETADRLTRLVTTGAMPTRRNLRSWWQRAREHLGLLEDEDFVFHTCRHTRATRMVDAGINIFVIKEWMGHKCIETTLRYAHVRPQNLEEALVKVGDYRLTAGQNSQKGATSTAPTPLPTGGVEASYSMAA